MREEKKEGAWARATARVSRVKLHRGGWEGSEREREDGMGGSREDACVFKRPRRQQGWWYIVRMRTHEDATVHPIQSNQFAQPEDSSDNKTVKNYNEINVCMIFFFKFPPPKSRKMAKLLIYFLHNWEEHASRAQTHFCNLTSAISCLTLSQFNLYALLFSGSQSLSLWAPEIKQPLLISLSYTCSY